MREKTHTTAAHIQQQGRTETRRAHTRASALLFFFIIINLYDLFIFFMIQFVYLHHKQ